MSRVTNASVTPPRPDPTRPDPLSTYSGPPNKTLNWCSTRDGHHRPTDRQLSNARDTSRTDARRNGNGQENPMRQPTRSDYRHKSTPNNSAWRRGCRCPDCVTAHRTWLQQQRDSGVTRKQYRRPVPLCPVHDAETFDVCLCGGR